MPSLGETVTALARRRLRRGGAAGASGPPRLSESRGFGPNPGELRMFSYVPADLPQDAPLVVVLHGCGQTAEGYASGAGWLDLAEQVGFAVLAPEQTQANNPNLCFNWFQPEDVGAGIGEAASIGQMVAAAIGAHGLDPARVFVTGLSAGGAMTAALLAAYPEVFAGGAVVAGLPYRAADNLQQAFGAMYQPAPRSARAWGDLVRAASPKARRWPKVSIWHGDADATVRFGNAGELAKQWADVHGLPAAPTRTELVDGHRRAVWTDASGEAVIEAYTIAGLGHGAPLASGGEDGLGAAGAFMLEAGISSSRRIAEFWGLAEGGPHALAEAARPTTAALRAPDGMVDVHAVINEALASAGLIRR